MVLDRIAVPHDQPLDDPRCHDQHREVDREPLPGLPDRLGDRPGLSGEWKTLRRHTTASIAGFYPLLATRSRRPQAGSPHTAASAAPTNIDSTHDVIPVTSA